MAGPPRSRARAVLGAAAGVVLVAAAVVLGTALLGGDEPAPRAQPPSTAPPSTGPVPPTTVAGEFTEASAEEAARAITEIRLWAQQTLDASVLERIYTPDCECLERDRKIIADLRDEGVRLKDPGVQIARVRVTSFEPANRGAVVEITADIGPAEYVNAQGEVVKREPGTGKARYQVNLVWDGSVWRQLLAQRLE